MDKKIIKRDISLRFIAICQYLIFKYNIDSEAAFAKKLGIHSQVFSDIKSGKLQVGIDSISILLSFFDNINVEWLFTGNGDMLMYQTRKQKDAISEFYNLIKNDPQIDRGRLKEILINVSTELYANESDHEIHIASEPVIKNSNEIPIIEIEAAAGIGSYNGDNVEILGYLAVPSNALQRRDSKYYAIRTRGHSMAPTIFDKDYLIIRHLEKQEWQSLRDEYVYVVVDKEGKAYVKRIKDRLHRGFIVCMSDNLDKANYPNFSLEQDELVNLFYVEMKMSPHLPNINSSYYERLKELEDKVDELDNWRNQLNK